MQRQTAVPASCRGKAKAGTGGFSSCRKATITDCAVVRESGHGSAADSVISSGSTSTDVPTLATSHIPAGHDYTSDETVIDGQRVHPLTGWILTPLFNLLYTYPVMSVPTGRTGRGMPTGMQIVARPYDDLTAFRVASGYASAAPALFSGSEFPDFRGGN